MKFYNAHSTESQLLKLVLDIKQIEYTTETVASECAIADKELLITDLYTAIKYLNERHPRPNLFSDNPEQNARLNMFLINTLKLYESDTDLLIKELELIPLTSTFLTGDQITIADLAILPILPNTQRWKAYKQKITEYLNTTQKT